MIINLKNVYMEYTTYYMYEVKKMTFPKGYTFTRVRTSHGPEMYVTQFGKLVQVVPCSPHVEISDIYASNLIRQIESD